MLNIGMIIALFIFPAIVVLCSLYLSRIKDDEKVLNESGYGTYELSLRVIPGVSGLFLILFFAFYSYEYGIAISWSALGYLLGMLLTIILFARGKANSADKNVLYQYLSDKKIDLSSFGIFIRLIIALIAILLASSQVHLIAKPLSAMIDQASYWIIATIILIAMFILSFGNRIFQKIFLSLALLSAFVMIVVFPMVMLFKAGGLNHVMDGVLRADTQMLELNNQAVWFISAGILMGLGVFGQPQFIHALMSARDRGAMSNMGALSICLSVIIVWACIYAGLTAKSIAPALLLSDFGDSLGDYYLAPYHILADFPAALFPKVALLTGVGLFGLSCVLVINSFVISSIRAISSTSGSRILRPALYVLAICISIAGLLLFTEKVTIEPQLIWILAGVSTGPVFVINAFRKVQPVSVLICMIISITVSIVWHLMRLSGIRLYGYDLWHEIIPGFLTGILVLLIVEKIRASRQT